METSQQPPGFGHRLYTEGDPRVEPLLQKARALAALRKGEAERLYLAPPNAGHLSGNRATKQRRLAGFHAMHTIRSPKPGRRSQHVTYFN